MRGRRYLRLFLILTISLGILVSFSWLPFFSQAPAAFAHAFVIGSDPVDGSTIATAPSVIRIFFNADISPSSNARVYVFAPGGPANGSEVDAGHSSIPANHARELDTPLIASTSLPQGSYEVKWSALALDDGHATNGLIGFNLGTSVTGLAGTPILGPSTSNYLPQLNVQGVLSVMWEWLTMLALLFWVGLVTMEGLFLLSARTNVDDTEGGVLVALRKQGRPLQWLCLSAILVGEIINLVLRGALLTQVHAQSGIDVGTIRQVVFETSYGLFWLARICLICIALGFLWWTTREQTRRQGVSPLSHTRANPLGQLRMQVMEERKKEESPAKEETGDATEQPELTPALIAALPTTPVVASPLPTRATRRVSVASWHTIAWLTLAALMLLTLAFSSDTAQLAQAHYSAIILTWLQLLAQAAWFGGAAYLGFVLLPSLTTLKPDHGDFLLNLLRYYTPLALTSLAVALLGSLFLVETTISNAQQWLNDAYGRSLLVMLLLFALMLIFTLYSFFYLRASLRRQVILLPVVNADLPGRRARHSALEQTENGLKHAMHILAALGAGVLLCGALMSFFAPPIVFPDVTYKLTITTDSTPQLNVLTQQVGNLTVSLEMQPGRVGVANTMIITLKDRGTSQPVTNARISAITNMQIMDMGTVNKELAAAGSNATYTTTFQPGEAFSMIGAWVISLNIQQPGRAAVQTQFVVTLTS